LGKWSGVKKKKKKKKKKEDFDDNINFYVLHLGVNAVYEILKIDSG